MHVVQLLHFTSAAHSFCCSVKSSLNWVRCDCRVDAVCTCLQARAAAPQCPLTDPLSNYPSSDYAHAICRYCKVFFSFARALSLPVLLMDIVIFTVPAAPALSNSSGYGSGSGSVSIGAPQMHLLYDEIFFGLALRAVKLYKEWPKMKT